MSNKKFKMEKISREWGELENSMGEMAALEVACENNGVDSDWYWDNISLLPARKGYE